MIFFNLEKIHEIPLVVQYWGISKLPNLSLIRNNILELLLCNPTIKLLLFYITYKQILIFIQVQFIFIFKCNIYVNIHKIREIIL